MPTETIETSAKQSGELTSAKSTITKNAVLGFILLGGSLSGALVRDIRLANEVARRGYRVHVWWAMDRSRADELDPNIRQHWLFHGMRFRTKIGRNLMEALGRFLSAMVPEKARAHFAQRRAKHVERMMENLTRCVCDGVEREMAVVRRFADELEQAGVTHVLPMLEFLCPWVDAARKLMSRAGPGGPGGPGGPVKYVVTFQGYELYSTYARTIGRERDLYARLVETVERSDFPGIAVSEDYLQRVVQDIGVPAEKLRSIPPGVPGAKKMDAVRAREVLLSKFAAYDGSRPLISYLGRRDAEKGIDILLYAVKILKQRGVNVQVAICGPSLWGDQYGKVCQKIAEELRLEYTVMWRRYVPDEVRSALFSASHCIVYPSIHREPFGMVAAEAIAHGTPAIVPDYGGVAGAIEAEGEIAGLRFKAWDSGDLADQIEKLLKDRALHAKLSEAGPRVAEYFSIEKLGERVLGHLGLLDQSSGGAGHVARKAL